MLIFKSVLRRLLNNYEIFDEDFKINETLKIIEKLN